MSESDRQEPGTGRHAWGVFKRGHDPGYQGRGPEILVSTHKTSVVAKEHAARSWNYHVRRLTKAERGR